MGAFLIVGLVSTGHAGEMQERKNLQADAVAAFRAERFDELEATALAYRTQRSRTSSGLWKLTVFNTGVANEAYCQDEQGRESAKAIATRWKERYPRSPSAHLEYAYTLLAAAGGCGAGGEISPAATAEQIQAARRYLEEHKAAVSVDPRWYELMLVIAYRQSWERKQVDALFNEAVKREPGYYQTYFAVVRYLRDKSGLANSMDTFPLIKDFADTAVRQTPQQEGDELYARIYWMLLQRREHEGLFQASLVDWPRMRAGFDGMLRRYDDDWNRNNYARFACLAKDYEKAAELLERIGEDAMPQVWDDGVLYDQCRVETRYLRHAIRERIQPQVDPGPAVR